MPRPRRDGAPAAAPNKRKLSDIFLKKLKPQSCAFTVWDNHQRGLAVVVQPTGHKAWKCIYSMHGRKRWYHIGAVDAVAAFEMFELDKVICDTLGLPMKTFVASTG